MKKIFINIILILIIGSINSIRAQWVLQNSSSQNYNFRDVFTLDQNAAFALGYDYTSDETIVLKTTNGGENWISISVDSIEYHSYSSFYFINDSIGWIAGGCPDLWSDADFGLIEKTTDAGESWAIDTIGRGALNSVVFVDENTGWAAGIDVQYGPVGCLYKTTNAGMNWDLIYGGGGWYGSGPLWSVCFVDTNIGWIISLGYNYGQTRLLKTSDGGMNWVAQLDTGFYSLKSVFFTNESVGWAIGAKWNGLPDQGVIFGTTDGGENWIIQLAGVTNKLNDVNFIDENVGWTVGSGGIILHTTDAGINWISQSSGTTNDLYSVHFANENVGWAVGDSGIILKTTNGGVTNLADNNSVKPTDFLLYQNYPNPFNPITNISYTLPSESQIKLSVYNLLGELVETIVNKNQVAGKYDTAWNAGNHPSGVYIYTLDAVSVNGSMQTKISKKMILMK